jgi:ParB family chromosome partitioning protein
MQAAAMCVEVVDVDKVVKSTNIRKKMSKSSLKDLAKSIEQIGLHNPVTVSVTEDGRYILREGHRRYKAVTEILGWKTIPVNVISYTDEDDIVVGQLIENLQREELDVTDEAIAIQKLIAAKGLKGKEIADMIGKSTAYVSNRVALLKIDKEAQKFLKDNNLNFTAAREIAKLPKDEQMKVLKEFKAKEDEKAAKEEAKHKAAAEKAKAEGKDPPAPPKKKDKDDGKGSGKKVTELVNNKRGKSKHGATGGRKPHAERLKEQLDGTIAKFCESLLKRDATDDEKTLLSSFFTFLADERMLMIK